MAYKTTDGLMRHLRKNGIDISGSSQKRQLVNTGYYHGYKGYRFFKTASRRLPFVSYEEIYATIQYDTKLKSMLYARIMFIETAVKNISLNCILEQSKSESIQDMYDRVISSYQNAPSGSTDDQKKNLQENKLRLQGSIQYSLSSAYKKENPKITHFYNNMSYADVPIWALFEILTMGDFGFLLQCLSLDTRKAISHRIGLNLSSDTNCVLIYKYIYALKDLRNAIAHNDVIFDTRFCKFDPTKAMKRCLEMEIGLPYVNFKSIGDYIILISYFLKMLNVSKTEIKAFIREFEKIAEEYKNAVNPRVASMVIHSDWSSRLTIVKNYI